MLKGKRVTGYWTFFCNPKYWAVDDFLINNLSASNPSDRYRISSWQKDYFELGQLGVIRVGCDTRSRKQLDCKLKLQRGIYAIVRITSKPFKEKGDGDFKIPNQKNDSSRYSIGIEYIKNYILNPVLLTEIKDDFIIKADPYLLRGMQAASMPLLEDAFNRILLYAEKDTIDKYF